MVIRADHIEGRTIDEIGGWQPADGAVGEQVVGNVTTRSMRLTRVRLKKRM
jgi:hypothetical protein